MTEPVKSDLISPSPSSKTFGEFLRSTPPQTAGETASDAIEFDNRTGGVRLAKPRIELYCQKCEGIRWFACEKEDIYPQRGDWKFGFMFYRCRNCNGSTKQYALAVNAPASGYSAEVYKYGELPTFGDPLPSRIWTLIGEDKELFLQGWRSELRGLGIGALTYYRRVVEDQWERIVGEIVRVAERLGGKPEVIQELQRVAKHTQFGRAVDTVKPAIPEMLLIKRVNPVTLLHSACGEGIHDSSDEECLELAQDIRTVLVELAERMSQALKDDAELKGAVSRLQGRLAEKAKPAVAPASEAGLSPPKSL